MRLIDIANNALSEAKRKGATDAEVCISEIQKTSVSLQDNAIHIATVDMAGWTGIRTFKGNSVGFSAVNSQDIDKINSTIDEAMGIARIAPPDKNNVLPEPTSIRWIKGMYDSKIADLELDKAISMAIEMLDYAKGVDKRVTVDGGGVDVVHSKTAIVNSKGVKSSMKGTSLTHFIMGMAKDGDIVSSFDFGFGGSRNLDEVDVKKSSITFGKNVIASLGAKPGKTFKGTVILEPEALDEIVIYPLIWSMYAENIQMGSSRLADKLGNKIASSQLTIKDWGRAPGRIGSSPFDREGLPPKRLYPVYKGKFHEMYHNTKTATRYGVESTGHAGGSAGNVPSISCTNVYVKPGKESLADIIADTKLGITVKRFSGNIDPSSGDFSGTVKGGYLIENGKKTTPLIGTMISGNMFDLIKSISAISSDTSDLITSVLPHIRFEGVSVSSAK